MKNNRSEEREEKKGAKLSVKALRLMMYCWFPPIQR